MADGKALAKGQRLAAAFQQHRQGRRVELRERAGIREDLWKEVVDTMQNHPFEKTAANWVRTHATAHARRYHEMQQVASVLRQLHIEPTMTDATVAFFARSGTLGLQEKFTQTPAEMDEVVKFFNERLRPQQS